MPVRVIGSSSMIRMTAGSCDEWPGAGACEVLELPAPLQVGAGRQLHMLGNLRLRVLYHAGDIAAPDIGLHDDATFPVLAADLIRPLANADVGHAAQRDE